MGRRTRRVNLAAHVAVSVGWIGAVAAFAVIAGYGAGLPPAAQAVAGVYAALSVLMWTVIVPLAVLSLVTGVVQAVGTTWGLFRHYWVAMKLVLTVGATGLLLLHARVAGAAMTLSAGGDPHLVPLQQQLLFDSVLGLVVLVLIAVLGWLKPKGRIVLGSSPVTADPDER